jgi:5'-nucleotidase/UDP-sugar diphosphatase
MSGGCAPLAPGAARGAWLRLLSLNDVYTLEAAGGVGGLSCASSVVARLRDEAHAGGGDALVVVAGDFLGGSGPAVKTRGLLVVETLAVMGVDAVVLGNHEFDHGAARIEELVPVAPGIRWLGGNVYKAAHAGVAPDRRGGPLLEGVRGECVVELPRSGLRVGLLGVCTQATPVLSNPGPSVAFGCAVEAAQRSAQALANDPRGAPDLLVALTHLSLGQDKELLAAVPAVDVLLGGHEHDPLSMLVHDTLLFKCGQNACWVGVVDVVVTDRARPREQRSLSWAMVSTAGAACDPRCDALLQRFKQRELEEEAAGAETARGAGLLDPVVRIEGAELNTRTAALRRRETSAGTLVADAMLFYFRSRGAHVDLGLINGGFIRGDKQYPPGTTLTKRDIVSTEMPFKRDCVAREISGEHLLEAIEQTLRAAPEPSGAFPHFSDGVRVEWDPRRAPGSRVVAMHIAGAPLEPARRYTFCCTEFQATGGDGCSAFAYGVPATALPVRCVSDVLLDFFAQHPVVTPSTPGRLVDVSERRTSSISGA